MHLHTFTHPLTDMRAHTARTRARIHTQTRTHYDRITCVLLVVVNYLTDYIVTCSDLKVLLLCLSCSSCRNFFDMVRFDFMLDEHLNVYLLEVRD